MGHGIAQQLFSRCRQIHIVRRIHRLLPRGISHGEEIAVGIVGEGGGEEYPMAGHQGKSFEAPQ